MSITINDQNTKVLTLKKGEGKELFFEYDCTIVDAEFGLIVKDSSGTTKITKVNGDFDVTDIANKTVSVVLTTTDLNLTPGKYELEIKTTWDSLNSVDKSETINLIIQNSLHA